MSEAMAAIHQRFTCGKATAKIQYEIQSKF